MTADVPREPELEETYRSIVRCILAGYVYSSPTIKLTELGVRCLVPILRFLRWNFNPFVASGEQASDQKGAIASVVNSCIGNRSELQQEDFLSAFHTKFLGGDFRTLDFFKRVETKEGYEILSNQLAANQFPFRDFVLVLGVYIKNWAHSNGLLREESAGLLVRA